MFKKRFNLARKTEKISVEMDHKSHELNILENKFKIEEEEKKNQNMN